MLSDVCISSLYSNNLGPLLSSSARGQMFAGTTVFAFSVIVSVFAFSTHRGKRMQRGGGGHEVDEIHAQPRLRWHGTLPTPYANEDPHKQTF